MGLGFLPSWEKDFPELYSTRSWINEYSFGVYLLFDENDELKYIGSSCGGKIGNRIGQEYHDKYRHSVDVALFEPHHGYLALALEALLISRLKPEFNGTFKKVNIPAFPPWDKLWNP